MKTLVPLSFVAALVAILVLPLKFEIAVSSVAAAGFLANAITDYSRRLQSLPVRATAGVRVSLAHKERFGLAA
jgi:hypothetical protein